MGAQPVQVILASMPEPNCLLKPQLGVAESKSFQRSEVLPRWVIRRVLLQQVLNHRA